MSSTTVEAEQCLARTEDGERCSRPAGDDGFCYQHDQDDETVDGAGGDDEAQSRTDDGAGGRETGLEGDMAQGKSESIDSDIGQVREKVQSVASDVVGHPLDGITSVDSTDDGWRVSVEVVERKGVPDTQDILGRYEIQFDEELVVASYQRTHRFRRDDMNHDV